MNMSTLGDVGWQAMSADPSCVCKGGFGEVSIEKTPFLYGGGGAALPGLSHSDTAVLAGVLTGLATFLFLALPILCCLCPLPCCPCCAGAAGGAAGGKGAKKAAAAAAATKKSRHVHDAISARSTDVESLKSFRSFDKNWEKGDKFDYDNLYEVDMKLPRAWLESLRGVPDDQIDSRLKEMTAEGKWEGNDVRRSDLSETYAGNDTLDRAGGSYERSGTLEASGGYGGGEYGTGRRGREGEIVEYETTRQLHIETAASQLPEAEYIYEKEFRQEMSGIDKDNFMKIYSTYRRMVDDTKQTSF